MRYLAVIITTVIALIVPSMAQALDEKERIRSLWVWSTKVLLADAESRDQFLHFINHLPGTEELFENVFLYVNKEMLDKQSASLRSLIQQIHHSGAKVEAMNGEAGWAMYHNSALAYVQSFIAYQTKASLAERFDGFQYDVEPHTLRMYRRPALKKKIHDKFLVLLEKTAQAFDAKHMNIPFGMAIPTSYPEDFLIKTLDYVDYWALMDYVDTSRRALMHADKLMALIAKHGQGKKKIYIGLETQEPSQQWGVHAPNTFFDEGFLRMETVIHDIHQQLKGSPAYAGIALHSYQAYSRLSAEGVKLVGHIQYPDMPLLKARKSSSITIDGILTDWPLSRAVQITALRDEPFVVHGLERWDGHRDFSATVQFAWDADYLYLACSITDDAVVQIHKDVNIVTGDHIELWIDFDMAGDQEVRVADHDDFQWGFCGGDFADVPAAMVYWFPDYIDEEIVQRVRYAYKKTPQGYDAEIAVPWTCYPSFKAESGQKIRLNVDPSDTDQDPHVQETLLSTAPHRKYANPRTFRTLMLQ